MSLAVPQDSVSCAQMAQLIRLTLVLAALAFPCQFTIAANGWLLRPVEFMVRDGVGTCHLIDVEGKKLPAAAGVRIGPGTALATERRSRFELEFPNGMRVRLGAETYVKVDEFLQAPVASTGAKREDRKEPSTSQAALSLRNGDVFVELRELAIERGSSFSITTDAGVLSARSGSFGLRLERSAKGFALLTLRTTTGSVDFEPIGGRLLTIPEKSERMYAIEPTDGGSGFRVREFSANR